MPAGRDRRSEARLWRPDQKLLPEQRTPVRGTLAHACLNLEALVLVEVGDQPVRIVLPSPVLCHWCTLQFPTLEGRGLEGWPVGVCVHCHVFACHGHGAFDVDRGVFVCIATIIRSAGGSSGASGDPDDQPLQFPTVDVLGRRFPDVRHLLADRAHPRDDDAERIAEALGKRRSYVNLELAVAAVSLARYMLVGGEEPSSLPVNRYQIVFGEGIAELLRAVGMEGTDVLA
jgi:hypothetical protein